jgi:hypothetical protein
MRSKAFLVLGLLACLAVAGHAFAQEGHPLKGTWLGDWGPSKTDRNQVVVVMDWDGKQISGQINPGPNAIPIKSAILDPKGWTVHIEAGQYVIDGKIQNLGLYNRAIEGTWNHDNVKGDFRLQRQ